MRSLLNIQTYSRKTIEIEEILAEYRRSFLEKVCVKMNREIYKRELDEIENDTIQQILMNNGRGYLDSVALGIKRVVENSEIFKDRNDDQVKFVYKFKDLDLLVDDMNSLKLFTDTLRMDFEKLLDELYKIVEFINIKKDTVLDNSNGNQIFLGTLYFPSYLSRENWNDIFKKHIMERI